MRKIFQGAMAAALMICGASVFTACSSNDDNPATPDLGIKEMQWTALRQNADGTTAQQGMKWKKVE